MRVILDTVELRKTRLRVRQIIRHVIPVLLVVLATPAAAHASTAPLTKRHARAEALQFVAPIVDLLVIDAPVPTRMVPPRKCHRHDKYTVTCRFSAYYFPEGRTVRGWVRVHRQPDGLLGFRIPWDPMEMAEASPLRCGLDCSR